MRGICLQAQVYGHAANLCKGLTDYELMGDDGTDMIVNLAYKLGRLSVVSEFHSVFNEVLNNKNSSNESVRNFESRSAAQIAPFDAIGPISQMPDSFTAIPLLFRADISDSQIGLHSGRSLSC